MYGYYWNIQYVHASHFSASTVYFVFWSNVFASLANNFTECRMFQSWSMATYSWYISVIFINQFFIMLCRNIFPYSIICNIIFRSYAIFTSMWTFTNLNRPHTRIFFGAPLVRHKLRSGFATVANAYARLNR